MEKKNIKAITERVKRSESYTCKRIKYTSILNCPNIFMQLIWTFFLNIPVKKIQLEKIKRKLFRKFHSNITFFTRKMSQERKLFSLRKSHRNENFLVRRFMMGIVDIFFPFSCCSECHAHFFFNVIIRVSPHRQHIFEPCIKTWSARGCV